jgi:hypothetical protein
MLTQEHCTFIGDHALPQHPQDRRYLFADLAQPFVWQKNILVQLMELTWVIAQMEQMILGEEAIHCN